MVLTYRLIRRILKYSCVCTYVHKYVFKILCMECMHAYAYVYVHACMYIYMYMHTYVCIYVRMDPIYTLVKFYHWLIYIRCRAASQC